MVGKVIFIEALVVEGLFLLAEGRAQVFALAISVEVVAVFAKNAPLSILVEFSEGQAVEVVLIGNAPVEVDEVSRVDVIPGGHPGKPLLAVRAAVEPLVHDSLGLSSGLLLAMIDLFALGDKIVLQQRSEPGLAVDALDEGVLPISFLIKGSVVLGLVDQD